MDRGNTNTHEGQRYLGDKGLVALIAFLSVFLAMSTDLYLPALPGMAKHFNAPAKLMNLTVILFFVFYSGGMLIWGPLSDKYGRKPILLTGLALYTGASVLCACTGDLYHLIVSRILQASGGGAATAVATAIVKDCYEGRKRETVLAAVQSMVMISPVVAPVVGAALLHFTSWRGIFWTMCGLGLVGMVGGNTLEETVGRRYEGNILQTIGRLGVVLRNPGFASLLAIFSPVSIPMMAFVVGSSYIYVNGFGLSEQGYSLFFSINALFLVVGPLIYVRLSRQWERKSIIISCFATMAVSGLLVCMLGNLSPWILTILIIPASTSAAIVRPPSTNLMLEQQKEDTGSATSLITCFGVLMGSVGMFLISFDWSSRILALGTLQIMIGLLCGGLWLLVSGKSFVKQLPDIRRKRAGNAGP